MAVITRKEKEKRMMEHLHIPKHVHKARFALFLMLWKWGPPKGTDPFDNSESFRIIDMYDSVDDAKNVADKSRLDFLPGCAIIIDTERQTYIRADNFRNTRDLVWVGGLSKDALSDR
jgi:hypothetical protein